MYRYKKKKKKTTTPALQLQSTHFLHLGREGYNVSKTPCPRVQGSHQGIFVKGDKSLQYHGTLFFLSSIGDQSWALIRFIMAGGGNTVGGPPKTSFYYEIKKKLSLFIVSHHLSSYWNVIIEFHYRRARLETGQGNGRVMNGKRADFRDGAPDWHPLTKKQLLSFTTLSARAKQGLIRFLQFSWWNCTFFFIPALPKYTKKCRMPLRNI